MTEIEKFKMLQEIKDDAFTIYEAMRFQKGNEYGYLKLLKEMKQKIDLLSICVSSKKAIPNGITIVVEEDCEIVPGQKLEIHTNLTDYPNDIRNDLIFKGYIPSAGYIKINPQYLDDKGMHFSIQNVVPETVFAEYDACGYHFNSIDQLTYMENGVYMIKRGTEIGFAILKEPIITEKEDINKRELKLIDISPKKKDE